MTHATLDNFVSYVFNILIKYNPAIRFYQYFETRPLPIEPFFHQVEVLSRCMLRDPVRILIGDEIGLGKTITAIVLGKYLQDVGRVKKVLVLVPRILVPQWVEELNYWIEPDKVHQIERENIGVYRSRGFRDGWYVVSMDLFTRNKDVRKAVLQVMWDLIIVDEAHKVSPHTARKRWKYIGEELIAKHPERNVFLLSATPHKGFPDDYIARLQILDPNLEPDIRVLDSKKFYKQTWNTLVFRRMKRDVNSVYERKGIFKPAHLRAILIRPSKFEAEFYREAEAFLLELLRKYREASGRRLGAVKLLVTLLAKRAFSSPASAYSTLLFMTAKRAGLLRKINKKDAEKRADALRNYIRSHLAGDYVEEVTVSREERRLLEEIIETTEPSLDDVLNAFAIYVSVLLDEADIKKLRKLMKLAEKVREEGDTKVAKLEELVKYHLNSGSKIIIFTEYTDTAYYIAGKLRRALGDVVKVLTGKEAGSRKEREDVEKNFIRGNKYRVLVSTDVLSEGLNLQVANVLINYDLPWTPLKLEQRIGRVWRLGQERECFIYMLVVGSSKRTTGASRVVSKLYTKLLNMERAQLGKINLVLGKDVEIYDRDLSKGSEGTAILIAEKETGRGKKTITEFDVVLASLDDRKFEEFVKWYIEAIKYIERRIKERGVDPKARREITENIANTIGFSSQEEIRNLLLSLARSLAKSRDVLIFISEGKEFIKDSFYQKPLQNMSSKELIKVIQDLLGNTGEFSKPVSVVIQDNKVSKVHIFKVSLLVDNKTRYEDILGVDKASSNVLSCVKLLEELTRGINKCHQMSIPSETEEDTERLWIQSLIRDYLRKKLFAQGLEDIKNYIRNLNSQGLRSGDEWNKVTSFDNVKIKIDLIGVLSGSSTCHDIDKLVGEYDKEKVKIENEAIAVIRERLKQKFAIQDLHEKGFPFDLFLISKNKEEPSEQRVVEVKSWKHISLVIYTDNEVTFGKEHEEKNGNYWLYIVDLRKNPPRILGFKRPFTTGKLRLIKEIVKNNRRYYVYAVVRKADEEW